MTTREVYAERGVAVIAGAVEAGAVQLLIEQYGILGELGLLTVDTQVPGSLHVYGSPVFDALLPLLSPVVGDVVGRTVLPTYSFARLYRRGQELVAHRDRPACEHSLSLHLGSATGRPWPLWFRRGSSVPEQIQLAPGDAVVYQGNEVLHWRKPLDDEWYLQCFLHFVESDGPNHGLLYDRRPGLGRPIEDRASV